MITPELKIYNKSSTDLDDVFDIVVPRGAILADEMGLGKTMEGSFKRDIMLRLY